jgi:hypothetical protein
VEQLLNLDLDVDFQNFTTAGGLQTASYPTADDNLFSFLGASILIDGTNTGVNCTDFSVEVDNKLNLNRRYLNGTGLKSEQLTTGEFRVGTWEAKLDFDALTHVNRIAAASAAAGGVVQIQANWGIAGLTDAVTVTLPAARFDEGYPEVTGAQSLMSPLKGPVMFDGTNSPVEVTYVTRSSAGN